MHKMLRITFFVKFSLTLLLTSVADDIKLEGSQTVRTLSFKENSVDNNTAWSLSVTGQTGSVNYTLEGADGDTTTASKFLINQINSTSSELKVNHDFDYENTDDRGGKFQIVAKYSEGTSTAKILLFVYDANDYAPTFNNLPATMNVSESAGVDATLYTIAVQDNDGSDAFRSITLSIIDGNTDNKFRIQYQDKKSFLLKLNARLDHDNEPEIFNLTINATDYHPGNNKNGLWTTSYLVIRVEDVDDLPAGFTKVIYGPINITEDLSPGSFVTQVTAVDKDKTIKDKIVYFLVQETNPGGVFAINETAGVITLVGHLDRKTQPSYALLVAANSTYHDPVYAQVVIVLEDANVHKPNFTHETFHGQVAENAEVGTLVLVVQAIDLDKGSNADVSYSLSGEHDNKFIITTENSFGFIYVNGSLDYDIKNQYNFTVIATESSTTEKFNDSATVIIDVNEILANENNPKFNQSSYTANVTEGQPAGTVIQVGAVDADQGKFGSITYTITDGAFGMFSIDNITGWINTTGTLDRENRQSYILIVQASDDGNFARHTNVLVIVTVLDSNDNSPGFLASSYSGAVVENSNVGNTILAVQAKDIDEAENALFDFSVVGGNEKFSVVSDGTMGYITVNGSLDYEMDKNFTFWVVVQETATTEKLKSNASVTVSLIDVNDNNPVFIPVSGYSVNVVESSPNGTSVVNVTATDQDSEAFGQVLYSLVTSSEPFTIDPVSGEVTTDGSLDRERKDSYSLTIKAEDGGQPALSSYAHVLVNLTDVNDNAPTFSQSTYSAEIYENMQVGSSILTVTASDADEGSNSELRYYIQGGNGLFDVDTSGVIKVNGTLDYESNTSFSFPVFAEESSTSERWKGNCSVTITLKDVNEFDPVFSRPSYYGYIEENSPSNSSVVTVQATDQDGTFNLISYEILSGNEIGNFKIDSTSGSITTTRSIDRETIDNFILKIRASDNGSPNRTSESFVVIEVLDKNDHSPIFSQSLYNTSIPESLPVGTTILTVNALDLDVNSTNSDIRYFVSGSDAKFDVTSTGHVFVNGTLNFENKSSYSFMIFAEESGTIAKQQHNATIIVTLTDVNEYDPVFSAASGYHGNVSEDSPNGTAVIQVTASDQDGRYNVITYSIIPGNDASSFSINGSSGFITTTTLLDREAKNQFVLTVKAMDDGSPTRTSEVTVVIDVLDADDHTPVFTQQDYNATIFENVAVGTNVLTVKAKDNDKGDNAQFTYLIVGGDGSFDISSDGVIVTKTALDYETKRFHKFLVVANETNAARNAKANATVTIYILDVNEFNPVFSELVYSANISENSAVGTPVIQVNASDKDGYYNQLTYTILSGHDGMFLINATTGLITTDAALDKETKEQFILTVRVRDYNISTARTAETVVVIDVIDRSDHKPVFTQRHYNATVFENIAVDTTVLTVMAIDQDEGNNAVIRYYIVGGDGVFRVTEDGDIILNKSLDYETKVRFDFQVSAEESIASTNFNDTTNVTVFVEDVNEHNPVFSSLSYRTVVNDSLDLGTHVIQVTATDGDGFYNKVNYSIVQGNYGDVFAVNKTTGWITTIRPLDEDVAKIFVLTVKAEDNGVSPRTAEVLVVISINETIKNATFLVQDVYNITVLENVLVGSTVVTLQVRDSGDDINSVFGYDIVGGNGDFEVNSHGDVQVKSALNYESKSTYNFTVVVTEVQPPSGLVANATINIKVRDVNEFNPKFLRNQYHGNVSESAAVGTLIVQVLATDEDGDFHVLNYSIIHGNDKENFTINSTTGEIQTATVLDRETRDQFILTVRAQDNGPTGRTSEVVVVVDVLDISEHPPMFLMSNYSGILFENAPVGTTVLTVQTRDLDTGSTSGLIYSLVGVDGKFGVTSEGVIYVNGSLNYETNSMYTFKVIVEEPAPYSHLRHNASVSIKLMDVNEFNPEFNKTVYSASVSEKASVGASVVTVFASDEDKDFSVLTYDITAGNDLKNFSINKNTGEITIARKLDRESSHQFILTVRAEDNGTPARTSEVTVVVGITDSNDNGPEFALTQYNCSVPEDAAIGTTILAVQALDQDSVRSSLEYHILSEDIFKMRTQYGLGFIVVTKELDYEKKKSYSFLVYAVELSTEKRNTSVLVNVSVLDANDNRPVFGNSGYSGAVLEGMPAGTHVLNVSASDADSEVFGPLYYEIIEGDPLGNFTINNMTGSINTATPLDRELQHSFVLIIQAKDNGSPPLTETVAATVTVLDNNDATPLFLGSPYSTEVQENIRVNTSVLTIQATDKDKGVNSEYSYSLIGADGLFSIRQDGNIGHIMVAGSLDYERNQTFIFYVVAKETQTVEKKESNATVVVTVKDVNDNPPVFAKPLYEESVGESPTFPISVGTVFASDKDSGSFGNVRYVIIHGDENGNFTLNNQTGEVSTGAVLNREDQDRYVLTIEARDGGSPPRTAVTTMVVMVTDHNEQPPIFHDTPYEANVEEVKSYKGSPILKVSATDPDQMEITYTLQPSLEFSIEETSGVIKATGNFDREVKSLYNLTVTATDKGGLNVSEQVVIRVTDVNDNTPQFLNTPYEMTIADNTTTGTSVMTVQATDADEAHNGEINFSLLGDEGKFAINQSTGEITVSGKLDRQMKAMYVLKVIATDRGIPQWRANSTTAVVNLTDYSNGAPKFESVAYVGEINEGLGNTFVLNVKAKDPDDGLLGQITYSITEGNTYNAFQINSTGAISSRMTLDFENDTQKSFDLTVTVADHDGLKDTTQVRITVADVNDNAPMIINLPSPAEVNISDQVPAGTLLYVLQAQDIDSGQNGEFRYYGSAIPDNLTIDATTGIIKTNATLHSSSSSSILLTVSVKDSGTPNMSSPTYSVLFNIIPEPTANPFILPTLTKVNVFENASVNDVIAVVNASQPADNYTIVFQLPSSDHFRISSNGSLSLTQKLDRETLDGYSLLVRGLKGGNQALGYVSVTVLDVNDESPDFLFDVYKGQIDENLAPGSSVLQVTAVDKDDQSRISYSIASGNVGGVFNISADGEIQISNSPDYESTDFFNLTVVATDGLNTASAFAEITILDVNDNAPKFLNASYSATVGEDTPGGTSILQVSSTDDDGDIVVYSISGDDGKFSIDSITGILLTTAQSLDYEEKSSYSLNVTATDTGGLKSSVLVILNITDSNDHRPVFSELSYNVTISEGYMGILPHTINATDADSGVNGNVTYSIIDSPPLFAVDPATGAINLTSAIDRESNGIADDGFCHGVLVVSVQASDGGTPPLTDKTTVTVLVSDLNDNKPKFAQSSYEAVISVLDTGSVLLVKASDLDCGVNKEIEYSFTSDNASASSFFQINATTGNITIQQALNGSQGIYFLNVSASNELASPKLQSSVIVKIIIIENKNYAPVFEKDHYLFNVSESAQIGFVLGSVAASDVNQGKDGVFIYSIQNSGYLIPFDIDPESGNIILVRLLDREILAAYSLIVVAKDFGTPPLSQTTTVNITVNDVNDVVPAFPTSTQSFSVPEDIQVGSAVGSVTAIDNDANKNGNPVYVINRVNEEGYFRIDNSTGVIYLVKGLDREIVDVFQLTIHAYNHGSYSLRKRRDVTGANFSEIVVTITITDINDNYPEFVQNNYVAGFKDSSEPGTNMTTVLAVDKDEGPNSKIVYFIQSGNDDGGFAIDPATGLISTTAAVSQLTQSEVVLTVMARDSPVNGPQKESQQPATIKIFKLASNPLDFQINSDVDRDNIVNILKNITGPGYDIIIESITSDGLLSNVKYYVIKNNEFLTQTEMTNLIEKFCAANEEICKKFGINLSAQEGNRGAVLGEDDVTVLEAMLITLAVIIGLGGIFGILLLCCLRRRKRYMPVYEPSELMSSKVVSFDEKPHYFQPDPQRMESQEVEIHMDEEVTSIDSAEEAAGSTGSEVESSDAIAKVNAYMNQALMDEETDSDSDSSEDTEPGRSSQARVDGNLSSGSTEPLVGTYTITSI